MNKKNQKHLCEFLWSGNHGDWQRHGGLDQVYATRLDSCAAIQNKPFPSKFKFNPFYAVKLDAF